MSGKVESQVRAILAAEPDNAFTVEDLCELVYGSSPEKRHRVSMLRAIKWISAAEPRYETFRASKQGGEYVIYDCTNAHAYGMARLKQDGLENYRRKGYGMRGSYDWGKRSRVESETKLREQIRSRHAEAISEGGVWWRFARMEWLKRSGENPAELAALTEESERERTKWLSGLRAIMGGEPPPEDLARQAAKLLMLYFERTGETFVQFTDANGAAYLMAEKVGGFESNSVNERETKQDCCHTTDGRDKETNAESAPWTP